MRPVVGVAEMGSLDAAAIAVVGHTELVRRAGHAVAHRAVELLGGASGRRVLVIAGKGSNGADGRVAASVLARRGAAVRIVDPEAARREVLDADLIIDAAYGTGLSGSFEAPRVAEGAPVLAVDLPSGLDGDTGAVRGSALVAVSTVTMGAHKSGLLLGAGPDLTGEVIVADIGIDVSSASMGLVEDADLGSIPTRLRTDHKWSAAVVAMAGSPGMEGAAALCALGALRTGAGMVRLVSSGSVERLPLEVVVLGVGPAELAETVGAESSRAGALLVGPGLGADPVAHAAVRSVLEHRSSPVVLDADGLSAVGSLDELARLVAARPSPVICTPHDGELSRLLGRLVGADRIERLTEAVRVSGAVLLSKGPTTVVAAPDSAAPGGVSVHFVTSGTPALATAGTGDVLSGVIAALLARGLPAAEAAVLGAHLHGRAAARARGTLVAGELPGLVGEVLAEAVAHGG